MASREVECGLRPARTFQLCEHVLWGSFNSGPPHETFDKFCKQMDLMGHTCHLSYVKEYLPIWCNVIILLSQESEVGVVCLDCTDCPASDQPPSPFFNFPDDFKYRETIYPDKTPVDHQGFSHPDMLYGALAVTTMYYAGSEEVRGVSRHLAEIFTIETWDSFNEGLRKHLIIDTPDPCYLAWVNLYPDSWRDSISALKQYSRVENIQESIRHCISSSSSSSFPPSTNFRTLLGAVVWIVGRCTSDKSSWFYLVPEVLDCFPTLLATEKTLAMASFHQRVKDSGHTCCTDHDTPLLDLYVSVMVLLKKSEVPKFPTGFAYWSKLECMACRTVRDSFSGCSSPTSSQGSSPESDERASNVPPSPQPAATNPPLINVPSQASVDSTLHANTMVISLESSSGGLSWPEWANSFTYQPIPPGDRGNPIPLAFVEAANELHLASAIQPLQSGEQNNQDHPMDLHEDLSFHWADLGFAVDDTSTATQLPIANNPIQTGSAEALGTISALLRDPRLSSAGRQGLLNDMLHEMIDVASSHDLFISVPTTDRLIIDNRGFSSEVIPAGSTSKPMNEDLPLTRSYQAIHDMPAAEIP
ncbi:hypothetical protein JAAARDRAFT_200989 [Jaapia argillacea MUCL 33604]|uniref:Uncharacterized protein n=1 Tax=Jaapia argillacea MUCL 33604 TaxID=933084 RepID=A0A067PFM7_9AGAM|nr:hypothetical protein JAAARDRAFT_200989 [Jaapia argillacea MUCL 33604]